MKTPFYAAIAIVLVVAAAGIPTAASARHEVAAGGTLRPDLVADELPPTARHCIPGPHFAGRVARLPVTPATSGRPWVYGPNVDAYPHCRYDSQAEADRAARRGD